MESSTENQVANTSKTDEIVAFRFCGYRLLAQHQRLELNDDVLPLTTKLYHLLLAFLTHPGQILSKEEIVSAVWPGQIVTDAALAKQIQRLRTTLSDGDRDPPLIETHRGRGYRLTCPVDIEYKVDAEQVTANPKTAARTTKPRSPESRRAAWTGLAGLTVLLLLVLTFDPPTTPEPAPEPDAAPTLTVLPVTDDPSLLSEGAAEYLALRMGLPVDVAPSLELAYEPRKATELASLSLSEQRGQPVIALQLERGDNVFRLWLNLRTSRDVVSTELTAKSITTLLENATQWVQTQTGTELDAPLSASSYALESYFEGLWSMDDRCDEALDYFHAALASDPSFKLASLRVANCEHRRGNPHEAVAIATALIASGLSPQRPELALEANLIAARSHLELGDAVSARSHLEEATQLTNESSLPLRRLSALAALALLAELDGDLDQARRFHEQRLDIVEQKYPVPKYLGSIHLDLTANAARSDDHLRMREHADKTRSFAEESGDLEMLMQSFRYLMTSYYRDNEMTAAVRLALAARPLVEQVSGQEAKAFFMQFAALALNIRGRFTEAQEYTELLREIELSSSNPMYGVLADQTLVHRYYVQEEFTQAHVFSAGTRSRLESDSRVHRAIPSAMAFEAIMAARGASLETAEKTITLLSEQYGEMPAVLGPLMRARGHLAARSGRIPEGIAFLRDAEQHYRDVRLTHVADYVGIEIAQLRLAHELEPPWDDLDRLNDTMEFDYLLSRLTADAHARDGNHLAATTELEEAKLRGNQLWSTEDQLRLEQYRAELVTADSRTVETE